MKSLLNTSVLLALCSACLVPCAGAGEPAAWHLPAEFQVDGRGLFVADLLTGPTVNDLPRLPFAPSPAVGKSLVLTRSQIFEWLHKNAPAATTTNWTGADRVKITRRSRMLDESELKEMLVSTLQQNQVRDRGELEIRLNNPFPAVAVPDEIISLKILDLPVAGVTPNFIARFELRAGSELVGTWQVAMQARIMRDVWVARAPLMRGMLLRDAELVQERRDVLTLRDTVTKLPADDTGVEVAEGIQAGMPLSSRSFRLRPIIKRGKLVEAIVQDSGLTISLRVEVLEDGLPGQMIRVRNPKSKREFRGKVQNEETVLVSL